MRELCASCRRAVKQGRPRRKADQRGANNPAWKGGRHTAKNGYVWIRVSPEDPIGWAMLSSSTRQYVAEHRLVIAHLLGRALASSEVVHHINGIPGDNRIENLRLFSSQQEHFRAIHLPACPHCGKPLR